MRTVKGLGAYWLGDPTVVFQHMIYGGRVLGGDEGEVASCSLVRESTRRCSCAATRFWLTTQKS
ncbi:hypothetical protein psal_cds_1123 [Pandoravirus salinus]|uniref:Uncharacterized protein n=1 Tax=Pandoravirus salinus TaxID=1349410 RepID=S4W3U8_9VIRU|nr:hypothetical protein psal_cds_1123 [Pandoravirus salinus]AGO85362.1 hypothetical protein psal_cds_1123 [Pandoravirus salinus]